MSLIDLIKKNIIFYLLGLYIVQDIVINIYAFILSLGYTEELGI